MILKIKRINPIKLDSMNIIIATVKHKKAMRKNIHVTTPATRKMRTFLDLNCVAIRKPDEC